MWWWMPWTRGDCLLGSTSHPTLANQHRVNLKPRPVFRVLSTYGGAGTIKVPINGSSGEVPAVETRAKGPIPVKWLQSSCSGNVSNVVFFVFFFLFFVSWTFNHPLTYLCASFGINNMVNAGKECYELHNLKAGLGRITICRASLWSLVEIKLPVSSISKQKNQKNKKKKLPVPVCLNCASTSVSLLLVMSCVRCNIDCHQQILL